MLLGPGEARADWLITPFAGWTFIGEGTQYDPDQGTRSAHLVFGGSGGWLSDGILGFEAEFAFAPGYFQRGERVGVVEASYLYMLSGHAIVTLPVSVTRESLRPYLSGGLGVMDGSLETISNVDVFPELTNVRASAALALGGGVIGFIGRNSGVRFDLRHVRSLDRDVSPVTGVLGAKLSFWRFTVGVTFRP